MLLGKTTLPKNGHDANARLYDATRQHIAPAIAGFAHELLEDAEGRKIIFAARDGLGTYLAAKALKERFNYAGNDPEQLVYAYLTRKVVFGSGMIAVKRHLEEQGVDTQSSVLFADIGMFGSFIPAIKEILPSVDPRYFISRNPNIPGYVDNGRGRILRSIGHIMGNKAVHFLEDTYSGLMPSPTALVESNAVKLVPDTLGQTYPEEIAAKRTVALQAITDYVNGLQVKPEPYDPSVTQRLDSFLADQNNFLELMVPHER